MHTLCCLKCLSLLITPCIAAHLSTGPTWIPHWEVSSSSSSSMRGSTDCSWRLLWQGEGSTCCYANDSLSPIDGVSLFSSLHSLLIPCFAPSLPLIDAELSLFLTYAPDPVHAVCWGCGASGAQRQMLGWMRCLCCRCTLRITNVDA